MRIDNASHVIINYTISADAESSRVLCLAREIRSPGGQAELMSVDGLALTARARGTL